MTDFEARLRAVMESSVAGEQPPPGLVELVRRRHRRHTARVAVVAIAVVLAAAAAVSPARSALLGRGTTPVMSPSSASPGASRAAAAGHGQYYGCGSQTLGALGPHWRQEATHAGPIWFINNGIAPDFRFRNLDGTLKAVPLIVMMQDNTTAWVQPQAGEGRYFRFLPGFNTTNEYALRDGQAEATFVSCSDRAAMYGSGFTEYYIGIIVAGPRCIPIDVRTPDARSPARAVLQFGRCDS